jgi:hypothetical protein
MHCVSGEKLHEQQKQEERYAAYGAEQVLSQMQERNSPSGDKVDFIAACKRELNYDDARS